MDLRRAFLVQDDSKVLLLVSICTDDMIKLVEMHPEVWFMDVTSSVNKQKSDLFMLAIRTPNGRTFPGNFTFIPSGKAWVFQCIYQYAFRTLFGATVCSYNRLALFDDDMAEHGPFQNCIKTVTEFSQSRVMLCVFHAVWMPFKDNVVKWITARFTDESGSLTKLGKNVGKCTNTLSLCIHGCSTTQSVVHIILLSRLVVQPNFLMISSCDSATNMPQKISMIDRMSFLLSGCAVPIQSISLDKS